MSERSNITMLVAVVCILLSSCMSYERVMNEFNLRLSQKDLDQASEWLAKKKILQKPRNQLLFHLEMASLERLRGNNFLSIDHLNKADNLIEDHRVKAAQRAMSLASNPMSLPYNAEFYESIMVHYYKALNFLALDNLTGARVEARRANIALKKLNDFVPDKPLKYHDDVLGHFLMGLVYEQNKEWNNAFIAYRNAVNLFIDKDGKVHEYMGIKLPDFLVCDMLRMARIMRFGSEISYYSKILNADCKEMNPEYGELIVIWENGRAPIKEQTILDFAMNRNATGLSIYNSNRDIYTELSNREMERYNYDFGADRITMALPTYRRLYNPLHFGEITVAGGQSMRLDVLQDFNYIAEQSLRDRYLRELGNAILRVLAKRAIQESLSQIDLSELSDDDDDEDEKSEKDEDDAEKENENSETESVDLGQLFNVVSSLTEKADIRSWHNLPAFVSYARIPLKKGKNTVRFKVYDKYKKLRDEIEITVKGDGNKHVRTFTTPYDHFVIPDEFQTETPKT